MSKQPLTLAERRERMKHPDGTAVTQQDVALFMGIAPNTYARQERANRIPKKRDRVRFDEYERQNPPQR